MAKLITKARPDDETSAALEDAKASVGVPLRWRSQADASSCLEGLRPLPPVVPFISREMLEAGERKMEFQPPDTPEPDRDAEIDAWFAEKERYGYSVLSRDDREEWKKKLDDAANDGYAEGRRDEAEELSKLLPGPWYIVPPDGGCVTLLEQFERMAEDARKWREHQEHIRLAIACEIRCEG